MLIEQADLLKKLKQPTLRILDVRPQADYARGHIPGASWVNVKTWQELGKKDGGLHDAKTWSDKVGGLGISNESHVVVYGGSLSDAARVWWTLKYLGLKDVALLNGGWEAWQRERGPTDTAEPRRQSVPFEPKFQADRLEEIDGLKALLQSGQITIVDARSREEFTGAKVVGKRGGHIPGAKLLEWKELLATDGRFKTPEQLRELFRQHGITPDQTAVTC